MNRSFLIVTELGRTKGLTNCQIFEIINNVPSFVIDINFSIGSNRGIDHECVAALVKKEVLPSDKMENDYIKRSSKDYTLTIVEGRGLNYVTVN
jgi:hypothetical protein